MKSLSRIMVLAVVVLIAGTAIFLSTWDIPAPIAKVEKVIPNDRFEK
tara:strand:- start:2984 stop:3124 length:141 start_codon:yes stop_codon:yes gene_type:complete